MPQAQNPPLSAPLTVSVGVHCHPGKVREDNQDKISRFATPLGDFFLVADGVGGHRGGSEASRMIAQGYAAQLASVPPDAPPLEALQAVSNKINAEIYETGRSGDPHLQNMGSTVAFVLLQGGQALIGHVGDSRVYHIRDGRLSRVTRDHSAVQKLLDHGLVTELQARNHPDASVLTRSFGQKPEVEVDFDTVTLQPGDALLLCSDGLWGCVSDEDIAGAVTSPSVSPQGCADALLELALNAGGTDNISIEYLRFNGGAAQPTVPESPPTQWKQTLILSTAAIALVLAAGLGGWELSEHYHRSGGQPDTHASQDSQHPAQPHDHIPNTTPTPAPRPPVQTPSTRPPASVPDQAPAPGGGHGGSSTSSAPTGGVGVLLPKSRPRNQIQELSTLAGLPVHPIDDRNGQCAAQALDEAIVYYKPSEKNHGIAEEERAYLGKNTQTQEMTPKVQDACGPYDVIILPAKGELSKGEL